MSALLDIDDVCAGHPVAQAELEGLRADVARLTAELERLRTVVPISEIPAGHRYHTVIYKRHPETGAVVYQHLGVTSLCSPEITYALPIPHPLRHPTCPTILSDRMVPQAQTLQQEPEIAPENSTQPPDPRPLAERRKPGMKLDGSPRRPTGLERLHRQRASKASS